MILALISLQFKYRKNWTQMYWFSSLISFPTTEIFFNNYISGYTIFNFKKFGFYNNIFHTAGLYWNYY